MLVGNHSQMSRNLHSRAELPRFDRLCLFGHAPQRTSVRGINSPTLAERHQVGVTGELQAQLAIFVKRAQNRFYVRRSILRREQMEKQLLWRFSLLCVNRLNVLR